MIKAKSPLEAFRVRLIFSSFELEGSWITVPFDGELIMIAESEFLMNLIVLMLSFLTFGLFFFEEIG